MPRKIIQATPAYEIPTVPPGILRLKLTDERRFLSIEFSIGEGILSNSAFLLDAYGWQSLCDLRETLMPKRVRKVKANG